MTYHPDVAKLDDEGLVRAMVRVSHDELYPQLDAINGWERDFIEEVPEWWAKAGRISWKQRKVARTILTKVMEALERRSRLGIWAKEATG
jgi:hypothetical protein